MFVVLILGTKDKNYGNKIDYCKNVRHVELNLILRKAENNYSALIVELK